MSGTSLRAWVVGIVVVGLLLLVAFGLGVYAGSNGWTTPTVPPWPEPVQGVTP